MSLGATGILLAPTFLKTAVTTATATTAIAADLSARTKAFTLGATARLLGAALLLATDKFAAAERLAGAKRFHESLEELAGLLLTLFPLCLTLVNGRNDWWRGRTADGKWLPPRIQGLYRVQDGSRHTNE